MYICTYVGMYVSIYVYIYIHSDIYICMCVCVCVCIYIYVSLMKQKFVVTHTVFQRNKSSVEICVQRNCLTLYFLKNLTCLHAGVLRFRQFSLTAMNLRVGGLRRIAVS